MFFDEFFAVRQFVKGSIFWGFLSPLTKSTHGDDDYAFYVWKGEYGKKNYDSKWNPDCLHTRLRLEVKDNDDLTENRIDFE